MTNVHKLKELTNPAGYHWGFFPNWCKACGICIAVCPKNVLEPDIVGKPECVRIEDCINCGMCEVLCPDFAIGWYTDPLTNGHNEEEQHHTDIVSGDGNVTVKKIQRD